MVDVLGLGRICADEIYRIVRMGERFDSTKYSVRLMNSTIGGSCPRILACLQKAGLAAFFLGKIGKDSDSNIVRRGLEQWGIGHRLLTGSRTMRSIVVLHRDGNLASIYSHEEKPSDRIYAETAISVVKEMQPKYLILDARHTEAAIAAARTAHTIGSLVILDPGSTVGVDFQSNSERKARQLLMASCDIIIASDFFFQKLADNKSLDQALAEMLETGPSLLVITLKEGVCRFFSRNLDLQLEPLPSVLKGNSFGIGDLFRGWFLAGLLTTLDPDSFKRRLNKDRVLSAARLGLAAAAWRKQQKELVPTIPLISDLEKLLRNYESTEI